VEDDMAEPQKFDRRDLRAATARASGVVVGLGGLYALLPLTGPRWLFGTLIGFAAIIGVVPLTVRRTKRVLTSSRPLFEAIEALVTSIMVFVIGFSIVYVEINRRAGQFINLHTKLDAVYFTTTTLATVGFGDISASGQLARGVVTAQIALDVVIIAVVVKAITGAARFRRDRLTEQGGEAGNGN
jgi:voltage-gated potassium channel